LGALLVPAAASADTKTDVVITYDNITEVGGDTAHTNGGQLMTNDARLPYSINQDISHGFYLYFLQTYLDFGAGRAYSAAGKATYAPGIRDNKTFWGVRYSGFRYLDISGGMVYRYRMCCPAAVEATPVNQLPTYYHGVYAQVDYRFGPTTSFGKMFAAMANITHAEHQPDAYYYSPAGQATLNGNPDVGGVPNYNYSFRATQPLTKKLAIVAVAYDASDYYDNTPAPQYATVVQYGALQRINRAVSAQLYVSNAKFHIQGYPPIAPQGLHHAEIHFTLSYHYGAYGNARRPAVEGGTNRPQSPPRDEPTAAPASAPATHN